MTQNTEQNVRTRDTQILKFGHDLIDLRGSKACTELSLAERHILEAEARGAAEQRRKDAEGQEPIGYIASTDPSYKLQMRGCYPKVSGIYRVPVYTRPANVAGIDVDAVIRNVSELPDRTSPDDQPDLLMVTADELRLILSEAQPANVAALEARIAELVEAEQLARADAEASKARGEVLAAVLDGIKTYSEDTLAGPVGGGGDISWFQDGVEEAFRRARTALTREGVV